MEAVVQSDLHTRAAGVAVLQAVASDKLGHQLVLLQHHVQAGRLGGQAAGLQDDGDTVPALVGGYFGRDWGRCGSWENLLRRNLSYKNRSGAGDGGGCTYLITSSNFRS